MPLVMALVQFPQLMSYKQMTVLPMSRFPGHQQRLRLICPQKICDSIRQIISKVLVLVVYRRRAC